MAIRYNDAPVALQSIRNRDFFGNRRDPVKKYAEIQEQASRPSVAVIVAAITACKVSRDLETGKKIHEDVARSGEISNVVVANSLLDMYVKCGSVVEARDVFDGMIVRDVVSWTSIILGLAKRGYGDLALDFYSRMEDQGCSPDRVTVLAALKACAALAEEGVDSSFQGVKLVKLDCLDRGKQVHSRAARIGVELDSFTAGSLMDMYAKCGSMVDAIRILETVQEPSLVMWTSAILGYTETNDGDRALELFSRMKDVGHEPDRVSLLAALKACANVAENESSSGKFAGSSRCLEKGRAILSEIQHKKSFDLSKDIVLATTLVDMFSKCGNMVDARRVFEKIQQRDAVAWNCIISGYAHSGQGKVALSLYLRMREEGWLPDSLTFLAALKACICVADNEQGRPCAGEKLVKLEAVEAGKAIHSQVVRYRGKTDLIVETGLIDMYGKCGSLRNASLIFQGASQHSGLAWTAVIFAHSNNGDNVSALALYQAMQDEGCETSTGSIVATLKSLSSLANEEASMPVEGRYVKLKTVKETREIHAAAARAGKDSELLVATSLIDVYAKCGETLEAREIFESLRLNRQDDIALWNCMVLGYAESGQARMALQLYSQMLQSQQCSPDRVTLLAALKACACLAERQQEKSVETSMTVKTIKEIHSRAARFLNDELDTVLANTLLDAYAKLGSLLQALQIFESIGKPDVVSWNCIILGHTQGGQSELALEAFERMKSEGSCRSNSVTYVAALKACAALGALQKGRKIHAEICSSGLDTDIMVVNSLVDFYGKCGSMAEAEEVFSKTSSKNMVTWSALLAGYGSQGNIHQVFALLKKMEAEKDLQPDGVAYLSVLTACSHAGLVERGKQVFEEMRWKHGIPWSVEHYACIVDLLGRANRLDEAAEFMSEMPVEASAESWMALLSACHKWRNLEVGKLAFESLLELDRGNAPAYVLMSNIYASCENLVV